MKKITCLFLAVFMILSVTLLAKAKTDFAEEDVFVDYVGNANDVLAQYVDVEEFKEVVFNALSNMETKINVYGYNIDPKSGFLSALNSVIRYEMPQFFHVSQVRQVYYPDRIDHFQISYDCTAEEYKSKSTQLQNKVSEIVRGIKGNGKLTEVEKSLLLHDRLALICEYDYTYSKRNTYEALVKGTGVCEGYALAYALLLNEVGIKNEFCISTALNHAWNIVYIGSKPYHVDVTWDDPSFSKNSRGVLGYVAHDNFLRSTEGIKKTEHTATDFNTAPTDTTYDEYFWQNSTSAFLMLEDNIYYIDGKSSELINYTKGATVCSVPDRWRASATSYWVGNFSRIATDGVNLYYSLSKAVYRVDVKTGKSEKIFEPSLSGINAIYGLGFKEGYLICDTNIAPWGNIETLSQHKYQLKTYIKETSINLKENSLLTSKNGMLLGAKINVTAGEVLSEFDNKDLKILDKSGNILSNDSKCSTGCKVVLAYDGVEVESWSLVILGDVDGNGAVDGTDYLRVKSYFLGNYPLEDVYFTAADVTADSKIDSTDYLRIKSYFLGSFDLYA